MKESGARPGESREDHSVWPILLVAFLSNLAIGARVLIIPLDAAHLGQTPATIGLLYAAFAAAAALAAVPAGFIIDRRGSRSTVLGALVLNFTAQLLASTGSLPALFASQVLSGTSWATATLGLVTAALSAAPPLRQGRVFGLTSLGNQTGLMAGPAVAGVLVGFLGYGPLLLLCAVPPFASLVVVLWLVHGARVKPEDQSVRPSSLEILRRPGMVPIALLATSIGVVWGTYQAYFAIYAAQDLHLTAVGVGVLIAIAGFANTLSRVPSGRLIDRLPSRLVAAAVAVSVFGCAMVVLPHLHQFWLVAALLTISLPVYGMALVGASLGAAVLGGDTGRGRAIGVFSAVFSLSSAAAPAVLAGLMNRSFTAGFTAAGLTAVALGGGTLVIRRQVMRATAAARLSHASGSS